MSDDKYDGLTIDAIEPPLPESDPNFALRIRWSCPGVGFGIVDFFWEKNELHAYTEHMGRDFLMRLVGGDIAKRVIIDG